MKTIFWDGSIGALSPIKDVELYGSVQLKVTAKGKGDGIETKISSPIIGGQMSISTDKGFEKGLLTPKDYYIGVVTNDLVDTRFYPVKNMTKTNNFGDIPAGARLLITIPQWSKGPYKTQADFSLDGQSAKAGLRGVLDVKLTNSVSAEVAAGLRGTLQLPPLVQALLK